MKDWLKIIGFSIIGAVIMVIAWTAIAFVFIVGITVQGYRRVRYGKRK